MRPAQYYSVGIDPGKSGGIVILSPERKILHSNRMPESELGIWMWLSFSITSTRLQVKNRDIVFKACIEKVGGYVPNRNRSGVGGKDKGDRGSHMFVFGRTYGALIMALHALDITPIEIVPSKWQRDLGISSREKEQTDTEWKNTLKNKAIELFPDDKITLNTCDAALLAYHLSLR